MSITEFPLDRTQYELLRPIGKGGTAVVFESRCLRNNRKIAIKIIDLEECPIEIDSLRQETAFWSNSVHQNVVKYYGSFVSGHFLYILMEYMAGGSVAEIMRFSSPHGFQNEIIIASILKELLQAIAYFHENAEIHRDVKASNCLINESGEIKIGDFGVSANLLQDGQRKRARFTVIGTPCYMAPEVLKEEEGGYTEMADIWSLGITAIELAQGVPPYATLYPLEVMVKILESPPPSLVGEWSPAFKDFVKSCLQIIPDKRKTAAQLLQHRFFKKTLTPDQIKHELLDHLPTLPERFAQLNPSVAEKGTVIINTPHPVSKCPFSFDQPAEVPRIKTATSKPEILKTISPPAATDAETKAIAEMKAEVAELRGRAEILIKENRDIKNLLKTLADDVRLLLQ